MARKTIRWRLTLLFGITIVLVVALMAFFVSRRMKSEMIAQAQKTAVALAGSIAAASSNDFFSYNYVALEQKAEEAARDPEVSYVILYDKEGEVAAFSGQGRLGRGEAVPPLSAEDRGAEGLILRESLVDGAGARGLDVMVPVKMLGEDGRRWGTVRLGLRLESIFKQIHRTTLVIFLLGLGGTILGLILAALFTRRITIPLKDLVTATVDVSRGKYDVDLKITTEDEIQDLADNFRQMASNLRDQKQALEMNLKEIQELKHFSDLVMLSMTNGLMTLDEQGLVVTFNRMAEKILAVPAGQALGHTLAGIWEKEDGLADFPGEAFTEKQPPSSREIRTQIAGEERILGVSTAPIVEADESFRGHLILIEDLTEKRALEDRLRRADRLAAMGTLAAGLAHEIKNPLTAVRVFVQMSPEKYQKAEFREKFNRIVPRELDRVNELLENLLDLVRKPRLKIQTLDAGEIIRQTLETLEPEAVKRKVAVKGPDGSGIYNVLADESGLARALHNLVLNAIQAMPGGGQLTVLAQNWVRENGSDVVEITVRDTGPGIPEDQIENIFNPFFTSKEKGTGLGLAVSNKIIEDQGGSLTLKSERGIGTSMIISLPAAKPERSSSVNR